ncbi:hypothetical protein ACC771_02410, partial [Rhizobium ruizarguesonis]
CCQSYEQNPDQGFSKGNLRPQRQVPPMGLVQPLMIKRKRFTRHMTEIQTTLDNKNLKRLSPNTIPAASHCKILEIGIDPRIKFSQQFKVLQRHLRV